MKKGLFAAIFAALIMFTGLSVSADYSVLYITIDKEVYSPNEPMEIDIFNADDIKEPRQFEIVKDDTGDIVYRNEFNNNDNKLIISSPGINGEYTLTMRLNSDTYSKRFRVEGDVRQLTLSGGIAKDDAGQVIGIELKWNNYDENLKYKIVRIDENGENFAYDDISASDFIDVNIKMNKTYKYSICSDSQRSNELIIDTDGFTPSEYVDNNNTNCLVLYVGESIMRNNGNPVRIDPDPAVVPVIINNRVLLPIRAVVEAIGGDVSWDVNTQTVGLQARKNQIYIPINSNIVIENGEEKYFDVAATIRYNRTFVPVRHVESLDCEVYWNSELQRVVIKY